MEQYIHRTGLPTRHIWILFKLKYRMIHGCNLQQHYIEQLVYLFRLKIILIRPSRREASTGVPVTLSSVVTIV